MDIAQYFPQNIQSILLNTAHRIFNRYCSILPTEYSIDVAQYCPQNSQSILLNTVHRIFNRYCSILSTNHSMFLTMHNQRQLHLTDTIYCAHLQY